MNKQFDFNEFCKGVEGILDVKEKLLGNPSCTQDWRKRLQALKENPLRLVVMGECKRGKSSFVNALLGVENLVPVATDIATSTIFKIHYGEVVTYKVYFTEDAKKEPRIVHVEELAQYGTEDGNPGNEKGVAYIEVTCPSKLLENRVEIVDTPGLGGLFKNHKAITYQYVPFADAVFVVTDSDGSPIGEPELDLLKDLKAVTKNIYFVQTKSRCVDGDAREARHQNNIQILTDQAGFAPEELKYFVVDSSRKLEADKSGDEKTLKRSGFDDVIAFMDTSICVNARKLSAERFMGAFSFECENVQVLLDEKKRCINVSTPQELARLEAEIKKVMADLQEWQAKTLPLRRHAFELEIMDAESDLSRKIAACGADGEYGQELRNRIYSAKSLGRLHDVAQTVRPEIAGRFAELNQCVRSELMRKFNESMQSFLGECEGSAKSLDSDKIIVRESEREEDAPHTYKVYKGDDRVNRAISSFFAGLYRGALVGGAIGTVLGGPTGSVIGASVGFIDFTRRSWTSASAKDLASGQAYYWQQVMLDLSQNSRRMTSVYSEFLRKARSELFFAIDQGVRESKARMESNILNLKRKLVSRSQDNSSDKVRMSKLEQLFLSSTASLTI